MIWLRTLAFALLIPCTVLALVPRWLLRTGWGGRWPSTPVRYVGLLPLAVGVALMLWCWVDFARRGHGTPAPYDPPRDLVVSGPYRWSRNPMYVAGLLIIFGAALFWSAPVLLAYAVVFWLATSLFVAAYEEPALARQFGDSYERYRAAVPRWIALRPRR